MPRRALLVDRVVSCGRGWGAALLALGLTLAPLAGCNRSSAPLGGAAKTGGTPSTPARQTAAGGEVVAPAGWTAPDQTGDKWVGYPSVPFVPITTEIDGIEIPRVASEPEGSAGGPVPIDVYNPAAKGKPTQPVTGGSVTIRFNAEPKTLNPITETSAYSTYILSYTQDALAWQNPETFEFEPHVAKSWDVEDSVKLRPDFRGRERGVATMGGKPAATIEIVVKADDKGDPQPVALTTTDGTGMPAGKTWLGVTPVDGGETLHVWSDETGVVRVAPPAVGKYKVRVGAEVVGDLQPQGEGYVLKPLAGGEPMTLTKADVIDVQRRTVFTYHLRDDVTWSDGKPFTADDLAFAYAVINNPFVDGDSIRVYYEPIVECVALDDRTVRMKYRQQYYQAFEVTAGLGQYTPPLHLFRDWVKEAGRELTFDKLTEAEEDAQKKWSVHGQKFGKFFNERDAYNRKPLGFGAYVVGNWSKQDRRLTLERRKDYWSKSHAGHLDKIVVKFIEDSPTALQSLRAGEIDFFWVVTPEQFFEELAGPPDWIKKNYAKASWFYPSFSYVGWNMRRPVFKDRRVRLALAMLFNKDEFIKKKMHGAGVLVSGSQYYFGPGYDHEIGSVGYDPAAARDLLAEAGWIDTDGDGVLDRDGKPFRFSLMSVPGNPTVQAMVELIQRSYKQAGIQVDVSQLEWATYLERVMNRDFDVVTLSWASERESDPFQIWHGSQAKDGMRSSNHVGFADPQADQLIERIRVTLDPEERKRLYYDLHRILDREQPYQFLWTRKELGVYHQKFRGVKWYALRPGFDLREWYIPKELQ